MGDEREQAQAHGGGASQEGEPDLFRRREEGPRHVQVSWHIINYSVEGPRHVQVSWHMISILLRVLAISVPDPGGS